MLAESYKNAEILSKFTQNGKKYAMIQVECARCSGLGVYTVGNTNGQPVRARPDQGICYECGGRRMVTKTVREYSEAEVKSQEARRKLAAERRLLAMREANLATLRRFGFEGPVAYAILGNSYAIRAELKANGAKFSTELLWVSPYEPTYLKSDRYTPVRADELFECNEIGRIQLKDSAQDTIRNLDPVTGEYIGQVGDRITLLVHVSKVIEYSTSYMKGGVWPITTYKYIMLTPEGHTVVWNTSCDYLSEGGTYWLMGTVKEHSEYRNTRNTVLTRCKVLKEGINNDNA